MLKELNSDTHEDSKIYTDCCIKNSIKFKFSSNTQILKNVHNRWMIVKKDSLILTQIMVEFSHCFKKT